MGGDRGGPWLNTPEVRAARGRRELAQPRRRRARRRRALAVVVLAPALLLSDAVPLGRLGEAPTGATTSVQAAGARSGLTGTGARPAPVLPAPARIARARRFARRRVGAVSFAVVDTSGELRCHRCRRRYVSASVVKAMLLVGFLNRIQAEGRSLTSDERAALGEMIRVSDNDAADAVYLQVGDAGLYRVARRARMRDFDVYGYWGNVELTALDQAGLFARIDGLVPRRHRAFARALLSSIVAWQSWGIPAVSRPRGWRAFFKGGWRRTVDGELVHQVARLERGGTSISIAVLSDGAPSHVYGRQTVRGIAARLLGPRRRAARGATRRGGSGTGQLTAVPGSSGVLGVGPLRRFVVEVEEGLGVDRAGFAAEVERVLSDRRSWGGSGHVAFKRVGRGPASFRVILASPGTTDRLCLPLRTNGIFSCYMAGRVVLNAWRWLHGAPSYRGRLRMYRTYAVNHEVGHALGYGHAYCSDAGLPAPVMMQQTKGVSPCEANPWPLPTERD